MGWALVPVIKDDVKNWCLVVAPAELLNQTRPRTAWEVASWRAARSTRAAWSTRAVWTTRAARSTRRWRRAGRGNSTVPTPICCRPQWLWSTTRRRKNPARDGTRRRRYLAWFYRRRVQWQIRRIASIHARYSGVNRQQTRPSSLLLSNDGTDTHQDTHTVCHTPRISKTPNT